MANESVKLGISFSYDTIRFIEAEEWNGRLSLTSVVQAPMPKAFDFSVISDYTYVPQIADVLDKALENFGKNISRARVALDRRMALKKSFAIDKGLSEEHIRSHIEWELEQLLIAPRDEYNVGYEHSALPNSKTDVIVFAAVRKAIVNYVEEIFKKSRLTLDTVDLDIFSSIRALNAAYRENLRGATALVEFTPAGVGLTLLLDGLYALSAELPTMIDNVRFDALPMAKLALAVNGELQKIVDNVEENIRVIELDRIIFSGDIKDRSIISEIQEVRPSTAVSLVKPFDEIYKQLNIESQMLIDEHGERFLSCLGMIL